MIIERYGARWSIEVTNRETKQLLASLVSKVELNFDHERMEGRYRNDFRDGRIFLRPDAGGGEGFQDPDSTHLRGIRTFFRTREH